MPFVVLGLPKGRLEEIIETRVAALERRLKTCPRPGSTERRRTKVKAAIDAKPPLTPISAEFDAPQFAVDYARLAATFGYSHLMVATKAHAPGKREWIPSDFQP